MASQPHYEHDCDRCIFLAHFEGKDLYFCPNEPTVIVRHSSDPPDYSSGLVFADRPLHHAQPSRHLRVAWLLAKDQCIRRITFEDYTKAKARGFKVLAEEGFVTRVSSYIVYGPNVYHVRVADKDLSIDDLFFRGKLTWKVESPMIHRLAKFLHDKML